jgi:hypothetical protein
MRFIHRHVLGTFLDAWGVLDLVAYYMLYGFMIIFCVPGRSYSAIAVKFELSDCTDKSYCNTHHNNIVTPFHE